MDANSALHLVVFPWLAFGHILPFLELSEALARRGHRISFLSTPRNLTRLPKLPPHLSPLLHLIPLPLPPTDGLPPDAEATIDLPLDNVQHLKKAFDGLAGPFAAFLTNLSPKPDWVIQDFAPHWLPPIASESGVPCAFFSVFTAPTLAFVGPIDELKNGGSRGSTPERYTVPPPWIPFASNVACRLYEAAQFIGLSKDNASGVSDFGRLILTLQGCSIVAARDCDEFDRDWLCLLEEIYKKPVIPTGLLLPQPLQERNGGGIEAEGRPLEWLDNQAPRSVLYVAFGSEATLSVEQLRELAYGLELSKTPFLWVVRKVMAEALPEGFEDRIGGWGVVVKGWIPQLKILAHGAVGGFLTHCGWSSIIEGLQFGLPFVLLPLTSDQGIIARVIEEREVGVDVKRNEEDGYLGRAAVAEAVRMVMVEEEGESVRLKAKQLQCVFADRDCQEGYVDRFAQYLMDHKGMEG